MLQLILLIIVGSLAFRGASSLTHMRTHDGAMYVPLWFARPPGMTIVSLYVVAALPLAFLNGFLLRFSWLDCLIAGVATWIGMLVANALFRFNAAVQFMFCGSINVLWLVVNIVRAISQ